MIEIHWFTLYCIVAWTWAATCWAYEASAGKHHTSVTDSIWESFTAPAYFWLVLLVVAGQFAIDLLNGRAGRRG